MPGRGASSTLEARASPQASQAGKHPGRKRPGRPLRRAAGANWRTSRPNGRACVPGSASGPSACPPRRSRSGMGGRIGVMQVLATGRRLWVSGARGLGLSLGEQACSGNAPASGNGSASGNGAGSGRGRTRGSRLALGDGQDAGPNDAAGIPARGNRDRRRGRPRAPWPSASRPEAARWPTRGADSLRAPARSPGRCPVRVRTAGDHDGRVCGFAMARAWQPGGRTRVLAAAPAPILMPAVATAGHPGRRSVTWLGTLRLTRMVTRPAAGPPGRPPAS